MPTPLPVPMRVALPNDSWVQLEPEAYGVTNAAMLAVRRDHEGDYAPTITVSGAVLAPGETMEMAADEAVTAFGQQATDVELVKRQVRGDDAGPGLIQMLGGTVTVDERRFDVRQAQAFMGLRDVQQPETLAVVKVVLSATYADIDTYLPEMQQLLASLEPAPQAQA